MLFQIFASLIQDPGRHRIGHHLFRSPTEPGAHRLDELGRSLGTAPSRRAALRLFAGTAMAALGGSQYAGEADASNALKNAIKKCQKLQRKSARRRCVERAKSRHKTRQRKRKPNASCRKPTNWRSGQNAAWVAAQTFTEPNGGKLTKVRLKLARDVVRSGTARLTLNTVNPATGVPTSTVLAAATLPVKTLKYLPMLGGSPQSTDPSLMATFQFAKPPRLVANRQYALVLSRLPGPGHTYFFVVLEGTCTGGTAFSRQINVSPFEERTYDLVYQTVVKP